jgi:moderate conductance mechanosensitive channel
MSLYIMIAMDPGEQLLVRLEWVTKHTNRWIELHLLNIVIILVAAWILRRVANELADRVIKHIVRPDVYPTKSDREKRIKTLHNLANGVIRLAVYAIAGMLVVSELYPGARAAIFTSAGVVGVVVGFGAQNLIRDIVTGIFIITENQYRIGDEVTLIAGMGMGHIEGEVEDVTIRTTVLRDLSGDVHHVPNGNIGVTTNKTLGFSRMNEEIVVAFNTDLNKLEKVVKNVGEELAALPQMQSRIIEPPYLASVKGFSDDGITVRVLAKTSAASQWKTRSEFYRLLQKAFEKNRIKLVGQEGNGTKT